MCSIRVANKPRASAEIGVVASSDVIQSLADSGSASKATDRRSVSGVVVVMYGGREVRDLVHD